MRIRENEIVSAQHGALAYGFLRLILGINIAIHGISRIVMGDTTFAHGLVPMFAKTPLPAGLVYLFGLALPWSEAAIGILVLAGLWSVSAYCLGMLLMASLTFGSALRQDWESAGLQLIYGAVYAALLTMTPLNTLSLEGLRHRGSERS